MSKLTLVVGVATLAIGLYLSLTTNLPGAISAGLNGDTENALIFDFIGIVFIVVGVVSRKR